MGFPASSWLEKLISAQVVYREYTDKVFRENPVFYCQKTRTNSIALLPRHSDWRGVVAQKKIMSVTQSKVYIFLDHIKQYGNFLLRPVFRIHFRVLFKKIFLENFFTVSI